MKTIAYQLKNSLLQLFPTNKHRTILIGLVLIAASISVSELAVTKLFTKIILHEGSLSRARLILYIGAFFLFFGITRAGHYLQRIYRVNVFDKAFKSSSIGVTAAQENWRWSLAFELTTLLGVITQILVIVIFFAYLNVLFGVLNVLVLLAVIEILGRIFAKQIEAQRGFVVARKNKIPVSNFERIGSRIKSGEFGILISGFSLIILLAALIYFSYKGDISRSNTIVLFFGLRMQNSSLATFSTSLMRFARARTNSE
ncbi:MAG: hypothetical protein D4R50_01230 [Actinomycetales bacterium]|jgi:hypothetical protein|nr:MAG: hypothetical protein D4R50_01230 [Actinomycetales bacterium]